MKIYSKFTNINSTKEVIVLIKLVFFLDFDNSVFSVCLYLNKTKQLEHIITPYLDQHNISSKSECE